MTKGDKKETQRRILLAAALTMGLALSACGSSETTTVLPTNGSEDMVVMDINGGSENNDAAEQTPIVIASDDEGDRMLDGVPDKGEETAPPVLSHAEDYARYQQLNADVVGWISIANTRVEYPVVHASDNDYYLTRTVEGKDSKSGSIFLDFRNSDLTTDKHIIVYGHNMRNGAMFHDLQQYKQEEFFQNNRDIKLYYGNTEMRFEIYAAYIVNIDNDFIKTSFGNDNQFLSYMNDYRSLSKWEPKPRVELTEHDQILTLATCTYEYDNSRFVVQARRVG